MINRTNSIQVIGLLITMLMVFSCKKDDSVDIDTPDPEMLNAPIHYKLGGVDYYADTVKLINVRYFESIHWLVDGNQDSLQLNIYFSDRPDDGGYSIFTYVDVWANNGLLKSNYVHLSVRKGDKVYRNYALPQSVVSVEGASNSDGKIRVNNCMLSNAQDTADKLTLDGVFNMFDNGFPDSSYVNGVLMQATYHSYFNRYMPGIWLITSRFNTKVLQVCSHNDPTNGKYNVNDPYHDLSSIQDGFGIYMYDRPVPPNNYVTNNCISYLSTDTVQLERAGDHINFLTKGITLNAYGMGGGDILFETDHFYITPLP